MSLLALDVSALAKAIAEVARRDPDVRREFVTALGLDVPAGELMTVAGAAAHAHVHADTVRRWIREGRLAGHRAGRLVRVPRAELEALLAGGPADSVHVPPRQASSGRFARGERRAARRARRGEDDPELSPEQMARRDFGGRSPR